jgi:hypothetical protein
LLVAVEVVAADVRSWQAQRQETGHPLLPDTRIYPVAPMPRPAESPRPAHSPGVPAGGGSSHRPPTPSPTAMPMSSPRGAEPDGILPPSSAAPTIPPSIPPAAED